METQHFKLQPPGAGLPFAQRVMMRVWYGPFVSKRTTREESKRNYEILTQKLVEKVSKIPNDLRNIKILVDPIPGLEDSSRYWSLNEVMIHIMIVSKGMESVILSLAAGVVPQGQVNIAHFKPKKPEHDPLPEFVSFASNLIKRIDERLNQPGMDFNSPAKFRHPWLGEICLRQWYWLLGSHLSIHYRQTKEILKGLQKIGQTFNF